MKHSAAAAILDSSGRLLLIKENYDRRRYGFPGGAVELGESALDAVVREALEEIGCTVVVDHLIGVYRLENGFACTLFRCGISSGMPAMRPTGEIAEVGWFAAAAMPHPRTNGLRHALDVFAAPAASCETLCRASTDRAAHSVAGGVELRSNRCQTPISVKCLSCRICAFRPTERSRLDTRDPRSERQRACAPTAVAANPVSDTLVSRASATCERQLVAD